MRKPVFYSRSARSQAGAVDSVPAHPLSDIAEPGPTASHSPHAPRRWREILGQASSSPIVMWAGMALLAALLLASQWQRSGLAGSSLTQKDIDAAVLRTLTTQTLPSAAARAAEVVRPSVVRVVSLDKNAQGEDEENGVGTGVVIVDTGVILTNLHVVQGARKLRVVFADGTESEASITGAQPEQDLAVLQAHEIPDDLSAATMRGTGDLLPGDNVVAVGFPFGIGPSVSAGVVSGLGRSFRSPEGEQEIGNLIQFDAAANPGNSGGPLVTMAGEVVGIVTGILNPTSHRTFVGIGFAVPIESAAGAVGLPPF